jgi:hypothetical protein
MAVGVGVHNIQGVLLDTASDPDDTTLLTAPGARMRGWVKWMMVSVTTVQASSYIAIEDGVGGNEVLRQASTAAGTFMHEFPGEGIPLSTATLLNATIVGATGVVARVHGEVEVRGG